MAAIRTALDVDGDGDGATVKAEVMTLAVVMVLVVGRAVTVMTVMGGMVVAVMEMVLPIGMMVMALTTAVMLEIGDGRGNDDGDDADGRVMMVTVVTMTGAVMRVTLVVTGVWMVIIL